MGHHADKKDTRRRIYNLIKDLGHVGGVAKKTGLHWNTVSYHVKQLVKIGVLRRAPGHKNPVLYTTGPKSTHYEAGIELTKNDRVGRSAVRVHRGEWKRAVEAWPEMPDGFWDKSWKASGVPNYQKWFKWGDKTVRLWFTDGGGSKTLYLTPPNLLVESRDELETVTLERARICMDVCKKLQQEVGVWFKGPLVAIDNQPEEYGVGVPKGFPKISHPEVWTDDSPRPDGLSELEFRDRSLAEEVVDLPQWRIEVDQEREWSAQWIANLREVVQRTSRDREDLVGLLKDLVKDGVKSQGVDAMLARLVGESGVAPVKGPVQVPDDVPKGAPFDLSFI